MNVGDFVNLKRRTRMFAFYQNGIRHYKYEDCYFKAKILTMTKHTCSLELYMIDGSTKNLRLAQNKHLLPFTKETGNKNTVIVMGGDASASSNISC